MFYSAFLLQSECTYDVHVRVRVQVGMLKSDKKIIQPILEGKLNSNFRKLGSFYEVHSM